MDYLDVLESESIFIIREAVSQFESPALLFSGGKDSACLVKLAQKAFAPLKFVFPLVHIDTGHNFPETLAYRDELARSSGAKLIVRKVQDSIDAGRATEPKGPNASRNGLQSTTLLEALAELRFDCLLGGARRDEEKARAKERIFSVRDEFGQWDPKNQRPELWNLFNGKLQPGQNMRVFPLSNWTELDVWRYIQREAIALPSIYFAHRRKCIRKPNGGVLAHCAFNPVGSGDQVEELTVRCRTVGDMTCTGLTLSTAESLEQVIDEVVRSKTTERGTRIDDKASEAAMEDRKARGYF